MLEGTTTPNLVSLLTHQISPDTVRAVADRLGEDRTKTASAISTSVPSVLAALSDVARTDKGAADLQSAISRKVTTAGARPQDAARLLSADGNGAPSFLDDELGPRSWRMSDALARTSGLKPESAHKLQNGVASLALLTLGKNLKTGEARTVLEEQRGDVLRTLPTTMTSAFETRGAPSVVSREVERVWVGPGIRRIPGPGGGWIIPLLLAAAIVLLVPLIRGTRHRVPVQPVVPPPNALNQPPQVVSPTPPPIPGPPRMKRAEPNLNLAGDSPANGVASFLASPAGAASQRFTLSPLSFGTNDANPTPASTSTLADFARVLTAYPGATVRIESFTDNTGTEDYNMDLSGRRSDAVKAMLVDRGIDPARIQTVGLGQDNPAASNDTAAGRAQNRRSEFIVTRP
jgi:outer membrane protein OmpA-like peptidoglycan-associated protein